MQRERAALEALRDGPVAQLALLRAWNVPLPARLVDHYGEEAADPATYELEGDWATDARYTHPDRATLRRAVIEAALGDIGFVRGVQLP